MTTRQNQTKQPSAMSDFELVNFLGRNKNLLPGSDLEDQRYVCISRNCTIEDVRIDCMFVSDHGQIVVVMSNALSNDLISAFRSIRTGGMSLLDNLASNYFYRTEGQAAMIIDAMAAKGFLTYADSNNLEANVTSCIDSGSILFIAVGEKIRNESTYILDYLNLSSSPSFNILFAKN